MKNYQTTDLYTAFLVVFPVIVILLMLISAFIVLSLMFVFPFTPQTDIFLSRLFLYCSIGGSAVIFFIIAYLEQYGIIYVDNEKSILSFSKRFFLSQRYLQYQDITSYRIITNVLFPARTIRDFSTSIVFIRTSKNIFCFLMPQGTALQMSISLDDHLKERLRETNIWKAVGHKSIYTYIIVLCLSVLTCFIFYITFFLNTSN